MIKPIGSPRPQLVIINDSVGAPELDARKPIAGSAAWLLNKAKTDARLTDYDCATVVISSVIPSGGYDLTGWVHREKKYTPPASWIAMHDGAIHPSLAAQYLELLDWLRAMQPNVIVTLGEEATWLFTGRAGIGNLRGSILPATSSLGVGGASLEVKCIPTYHPRKVLRNYAWYWDVVRDLQRAQYEQNFTGIQQPEWDFRVAPTSDQVISFLDNLGEEVVCDIETRRQDITCVGVGSDTKTAMCIPLWKQGGSYWSTADEELEIRRTLVRALRQRKIINQNFLYDSFYFLWIWGERLLPWFDTMVAQHILLPGMPKSLDYLASYYCDYYQYWKHDAKEWSGRTNDLDLWTYNCADVVYTKEIKDRQIVALRAAGVEKQFWFYMKLHDPILTMMHRGINSNMVVKAEMTAAIAEAMQKKRTWLADVCGHDVNPRGPQLQKFLYDDLQLTVIKKRGTGRPTLEGDALEKLAAKYPIITPIVKNVESYRSLGIFKANFLEAETPNGRFFTMLKPTGTKTFRFSSTANPLGYGTNLQNVPNLQEDEEGQDPDIPNIRRLFLPDPGYTLAEFDLSKADLRVVVWESDEEELKEAVRAGVNIYKEYGTKITGLPYRKAKSLIHGTDYGGKPSGLSGRLGVSQKLVRDAQAAWFSRFPGIAKWQHRVDVEMQRTRMTWNKFGYRIFWPDRLEGLLPEALAWNPQSTVAIVINHVLMWFFETIEVAEKKGQLLLQVHDSILTQIKNEYVTEVIPRTLEAFQQVIVPYDDPLIIPGECKYGTESWADLHPWEG